MRWIRVTPRAGTALLLAACAPTTAPSPPPQETVAVLNGDENSISLIPVDPAVPTKRFSLGTWPGRAAGLAVRGRIALVAGGASDVVLLVDLFAAQVDRVFPLPPGSNPRAVVITDPAVAYVANAGSNSVTRVNIQNGDTASVGVGGYPVAAVLARGRVFVLNANLTPCDTGLCAAGPSWLTVVDPLVIARAEGRDSIPLTGPGQGVSAEIGGDGLIYVVSVGDPGQGLPGRLTIVDPLRREEVGSFGGFGMVPVGLASDGLERVFVTSLDDGLMEFNTRTRRVVRGAGSGVLVNDNVAAAVDSDGRVYAVESGGCAPGAPGRVRVFRPDLTEARNVVVGQCPTAATIARIPAPAPVPD